MAEEPDAYSARKSKFRPVPPLLREAEERNDRGSRQALGSNPFSRRMTKSDARQVESRDGRAGPSRTLSSPSTQLASKRQKLDHSQEGKQSKFFYDTRHRPTQVIPSTSVSSHSSIAIADAIIIDGEDDAPATKDEPHERIVLGTSSPDPMDIINPDVSYAFDHNKPSPMQQFSSEEKRKAPQDGPSTQRLRKVMMETEPRMLDSASRPDSNGDGVQRLGRRLSPSASAALAGMSSGGSNVSLKRAFFERNIPHHDLRTFGRQTRKSLMKPKEVGMFVLICGTCN
jgi:hypothetical protein